MKFGCLYYADSENIGDDIQTYAQWQFLPRVDYWIDRESLHIFTPDEVYRVALIMNAWFMYCPQNWPPSPFILPLFISTHFSRYHIEWLKEEKREYFFAKNYLKKYAPIGCRDASTLQKLQELDIEAYFSGCLTLTLTPFKDIKKQDYICLVDVSKEVVSYVRERGYDVRVMTHNNKNLAKMSPEDRLKQVEEYLRIYQGARCVLTSRLHCALPCTGLRTPVLVLYSSEYAERFKALKELFHITREECVLQGDWNDFLENPFYANGDYLQYSDNLRGTCREFVACNMEKEEKVNISYEYYREAAMLQNIVRKETYIKENQRLNEGFAEIDSMKNELKIWADDLQSILKLKQEEVEKLNRINNELRVWSNDLQTENERLKRERKF